MGCNYSQHEIDSCYVLSPIPDCKWIIAHCRGNTWKEFEGKKKKRGGEGGWRINCLSISQRIRDRNLVVKVDDKLKLGVGENVAPNTKKDDTWLHGIRVLTSKQSYCRKCLPMELEVSYNSEVERPNY